MNVRQSKYAPPMLATTPVRLLWQALPPEQLDAALVRAGISWIAARKQFTRPRISIWQADRLCVALGLHPARVYGLDWWRLALGEES